MSLQSFEAIYDHGIMKWLGDQPADIEARVIVTILPGKTASSASIMSHQPTPRVVAKMPGSIVRRRPHSDIAGKIKITGDIFDSVPELLWDLPK